MVIAEKPEEGRGTSFSYRHLGGMTNGVQVLWVSHSGGGSGVFNSLIFIRFSRGIGNNDGQPYDQLLMRCMGHHNLGDCYRGDVKVLADRVRIFPPPDEDEKPVPPVDVRIP